MRSKVLPNRRDTGPIRVLFPFLLTLLLCSSVRATTYRVEVTWAAPQESVSDLAGFRLHDLQGKVICDSNDPQATSMTCTIDIPGSEATFTLVSYSTSGQESEPSAPFTVTFESGSVSGLTPVLEIDSSGNALIVHCDGSASGGQIIGYTWNFNDGTSAVSAAQTSHTFAAPGIYTISLKIYGANGLTRTASREIDLTDVSSDNNQAPTAVLDIVSPVLGDAPMTVTFDASGSSDPEGSPLTYSWDFGDGATGSGSSRISHQYLEMGTYRATVTVTDEQGLSESMESQPIMVLTGTDSSPGDTVRAAIQVNGISDSLPAILLFSGAGSTPARQQGSIVDYFWDFGDGETGVGRDVQHTYTEEGTYTVRLIVSDDLGNQSTVTKTIQLLTMEMGHGETSVLIPVYLLLMSGEK